MRVVSVNVGRARPVAWDAGSLSVSSIEKHPVQGSVEVSTSGLAGNESADTRHHGGEYQRVYAYSVEDYAQWSAELGAQLRAGLFGEQLTTEGVDLNAALIGETWRVGTAVLEVAHVRIPCQTFKGWMGASGYDDAAWVKRFTRAARPGPYFRVLEPGAVAAGDGIEVLSRPDHGVSVVTLFRALTTQPELLTMLDRVGDLAPEVRRRIAAASAEGSTATMAPAV